MDISVVVPVYGCREAIQELYRRVSSTIESMNKSFELVLVDDHCPQNSWEDIEMLCSKDNRVVGVKLSRNFGQMKAISAGVSKSRGDWVVVMDCDLQDRPEYIRELYDTATKGGYDIVYSKRKNRKDSLLVKALSRTFYAVYNYFSDMKYDFEVGNLSIANRQVVDKFLEMHEQNRDYIMFLMWLGFKDVTIELDGDERFAGESTYSFKKKMNLALGLITEQSNKPLFLAIKLGFIISGFSVLYLIYLLIRWMLVKDFPMGWPTIVASIYLIGGLMLSALGIVGIYVGNIFSETKNRPLFVIEKELNGEK